jgi:hypothetical protein
MTPINTQEADEREGLAGVGVPLSALMRGPEVQWLHIDGPYITWCGQIEWLKFREIIWILLRLASVDEVGILHWPNLGVKRNWHRRHAAEEGVKL